MKLPTINRGNKMENHRKQMCLHCVSNGALLAQRPSDSPSPSASSEKTQRGENHGGGIIGEVVLSLCRALFRPRVHALKGKVGEIEQDEKMVRKKIIGWDCRRKSDAQSNAEISGGNLT